jgi:hypothetical protein
LISLKAIYQNFRSNILTATLIKVTYNVRVLGEVGEFTSKCPIVAQMLVTAQKYHSSNSAPISAMQC